ncbi:cupin domain-containing protein [Amorphus orientalis]|uniref:Quercetin dioxygenase-like cupin family protein n=1 Tax=Amorphus orientalis TaxID=649198 RepID=A0AAE4AU40_9HYPH|nr:cupin domain-containing protein [Amorphus orientalis]MDQ0316920.1 quercetin dioxygenase-like cupin family protein [Amorphus orientalis]
MAGLSVTLDETTWHPWEDPEQGRDDRVSWTTVFPEHLAPVVGIADIDPGGALPRHYHAPVEIYHVIEGVGEVEIAGEIHSLREGVTAYVPANAWHETRNTGEGPLRILYFFPEARFEDVDYHFR